MNPACRLSALCPWRKGLAGGGKNGKPTKEVSIMRIDGKEFKVHYTKLPVDKIKYDPDNPRRYEITLELETQGVPNAEKEARKPEGIERATRFTELVNSIITNKGISMPLVVEKRGKVYKLIDGDRRLGAVRYILKNKEILEENIGLKEGLSELPCIVVEGPLTEEERLTLLSHIHVHLVEWRPAAKDYVAERLPKVASEEKAKAVMRITKGSIEKAKAIEDYKKMFSFKGPQAVSWARELASIKQSLVDEEVVEATVDKAKDGKISSAVQLRDLRKILKDPDARKEYLKPESTIEDAKRVYEMKQLSKAIERPDVPFKDYLSKLYTGLRNITFEEIIKYKNDAEIKKLVDECMNLLSQFKSYL
jgi:hypothetical protein